ncbi:MAG: right-handed parallel beta-helix repeat-containing protein, partial [Verrucomicrobiota bacterium]
ACEQVPEDGGEHTIFLRAGTYVATRTAHPKSSTTITGEGAGGKKGTYLVASKDWPLSDEFKGDAPPEEEHLISFKKQSTIRIQNLSLLSDPEHRITGGIYATASKGLVFEGLRLRDFRWNGVFLNVCQEVDLGHCHFEDTSVEKMRYWGGQIRTRYLTSSEIHNNRIIGRNGGGYGYKAGGHTDVRIHHNFIDHKKGFGIESAHENEYGVEIDHNWINNCISIPKGGQASDPNGKGFPYSFWIHHNVLSHSYTIEGPRNHLIFEHNWVNVSSPNGRIYTQHGGTNHGPVTIRYNVIENVDRALVWMNNGLAENISVYHNTIFAADAGVRTGRLIGAGKPERFDNWTFKNNLVVAAWSQPRAIASADPEVLAKMSVEGNLFINCTEIPEGEKNFKDMDPGLVREGEKPSAFYAPVSAESFVVDRGVDVGQPFEGSAPDIGAFEFGREPWVLEGIPRPR